MILYTIKLFNKRPFYYFDLGVPEKKGIHDLLSIFQQRKESEGERNCTC
jgi:hypothetical protein